MSAELAKRRRQFAFRLTVVALVWSIGLVLAAVLVPAYGGHTVSSGDGLTISKVTLVVDKGGWVLIPVALPALICVVVAFALRRRYRADGPASTMLAWAAIALLTALTAYLILSVGAYLVPVVILLAAAARLTPSPAQVRAESATTRRGSRGSPAAPAHG